MFNTPDAIGAIDVRTRGAKNGVCPLDASALVPLANLPATLTGKDADTVDGIHAAATATANKLLALDSSSKLPASITGDADTLDGKHAAGLPGALVWDKLITGSAVTSVTTNGEVTLDGNTHGGYLAEFVIVNNSGSTAVHRLYYNNDTTNTNYYFTDTNGAAYGNDAIFGITGGILNGQRYTFDGKFYITPEGAVGFVGERQKDLTVNEQNVTMHKKSAVIANLTRLDIVSSVANGIGINSRFRLWRRV